MIDIAKIILQLTRLHDDEKMERDEAINNLTPINKVHKDGSITDTKYGITVSKFPPKNSKAIMSDLITEIFDKDLFDYFTNILPSTIQVSCHTWYRPAFVSSTVLDNRT